MTSKVAVMVFAPAFKSQKEKPPGASLGGWAYYITHVDAQDDTAHVRYKRWIDKKDVLVK
jgi:hypothetical protein